MKKIVTLVLALVLLLSLTACGNSENQPAAGEAPAAEDIQTTERTAYPAGLFMLSYLGNEAGAWMTRTLCTSHSEEDMVVYISGTGQVFDYFTYVPLFIWPAVWVNVRG